MDPVQAARMTSGYSVGPGHQAGLIPGDVIVAVNGQPIKSAQAVRQTVPNLKAGVAMRLEIMRGAVRHRRTLTIEPKPDPDTIQKMRKIETPMQTGWRLPWGVAMG